MNISAVSIIVPAPPTTKAFLPSQSFTTSNIYFGEGNDTPLQYSCLKYPMDGGAW